jgi:TPR repeat protein
MNPREILEAAERGDAEAQNRLGWMYEQGDGVERNREEAEKWYRKASAQGNGEARERLDELLWLVEHFRMANQGNACAQYALGKMYAYSGGHGHLESDPVEAMKWYRKAAEAGHAHAQYEFGRRCAKGEGVERNDEEAVKWFRAAAEQGDAKARYELGEAYRFGRGVEADLKQAVEWLLNMEQGCRKMDYLEGDKLPRGLMMILKKAERGDALAQCALGRRYKSGRGVAQDLEKAGEWYGKAAARVAPLAQKYLAELSGLRKLMIEAEQGDAGAQFRLGEMYDHGEIEDNDDRNKAASWYRRAAAACRTAAERGEAVAQYYIGSMYRHGRGMDKDHEKALEWLGKSAEQGQPDALRELGEMYGQGHGARRNDEEAAKWYGKAVAAYRMAAERGDARAQYELGRMYSEGNGVERNGEEAVKWFRLAAEQGEVRAQWKLVCRTTAEQRAMVAQYELGEKYLKGDGVAQDCGEAEKCFQKAEAMYRAAAERGDVWALEQLDWMWVYGHCVDHYREKAEKWWRETMARENAPAPESPDIAELMKRAARGDASAQCQLGRMYEKGEQVERSHAEAERWYRQAAEQGNGEAAMRLDELLWFLAHLKMANQGNACVQYRLYGMHAYDGPLASDGEALKWLRRSAEQGYAKAQIDLGERYVSGRGVRANSEEAEKWLRRAAAQENCGAEDRLSQMLELPDLMEKAQRGDAEAQYWLGRRYEYGFLVERNHEKAAKWYRKSAEQGERYGQRELGFLYLHGRGVEQSDVEAAKWLEKAAAQGDYSHTMGPLSQLYRRRFFEHVKRSFLAQKGRGG